MVLTKSDKFGDLSWRIVVDDLTNNRRSYAYYGGTLIEVLHDGVAVDLINIWNAGKGGMKVETMTDLLEVINAWLEGDYNVGSSDRS
jgi:hypothetical protein